MVKRAIVPAQSYGGVGTKKEDHEPKTSLGFREATGRELFFSGELCGANDDEEPFSV